MYDDGISLEELSARMLRGAQHELEVEDTLRLMVAEGWPLFSLSLRIHLDDQRCVARTEIVQDGVVVRTIHNVAP